MTRSRSIYQPRVDWTTERDAELVRRYPGERTAGIAADFGVTLAQIYSRTTRLGLKKNAAVIADMARQRTNDPQHGSRAHRFQKGQTPPNKGLRRPGWAPGDMATTQFKRGQSPNNTKPIGSYRIDKDGTLQRKISNAPGNNSQRWRSVHELVWIAAHGPVPARHIVIFKKGQRTNVLEKITLDRVECISLADNLRRNSVHRHGPEIAQLVQLRGAITRQINQHTRKIA